jgi:hypothetical protein
MGVNPELVLAIIPKVGSMISIPCSLFIIWESLLDHRNGKGNTIQRALVGMSTVDVMANSGWFLSTWAVPRGDTPLSAGNKATCNYQGFLLQLAIGVSSCIISRGRGKGRRRDGWMDSSRKDPTWCSVPYMLGYVIYVSVVP